MEAIARKLEELRIAVESIAHAGPVMTAEEQVQALGALADTCTKNLFLKDKKGRLFLVTALAGTKIDLKLLSARLGSGKSGVRMAPDELIASVLQVPLGSVTPLALCQPSAAGVVLLLDCKVKAQDRVAVHPLENTASLLLAPAGLEALLQSAGVAVHYVDLEADPTIDKDNPPDLKPIADAAPVLAKEEAGAAAAGAPAAAAKPAAAAGAAGGKKQGEGKKGGAAEAAPAAPAPRGDDVQRFLEAIVGRVQRSEAAGGKGLAELDGDTLRKVKADLAMELNALRNAAYARGYKAANAGVIRAVGRQFA